MRRRSAFGMLLAGTVVIAAAVPALAATPTPPFTQCPPVGADTTGCGLLLTINPDGTVTVLDSGQGPYDGIDDTLIGVQNNSTAPIPKLSLTGTTQPFGFDGDGICAPGQFNPAPPNCPFGATGYEGPNTSFSNINTTNYNSGDVNFLNGGIKPGGSAYFSLEGVVTAQNIVITPPNLPPNCAGATPGPKTIWPPDHKMVKIAINGVTDPDKGDTVSLKATGVTQDEPLNRTADGNTTPDAGITTAGAVSVRAERQGTGNGRVYVISFTATDNHGATCTGHVSVAVPHDQSGRPAVDSGQKYNSLH
jgi:hypothetical protein